VLQQLDDELIGLQPIKQRIREIAALLLVDRVQSKSGLASQAPTLHMSFTGDPGTGKTTMAIRMAEILHKLGYVRRWHRGHPRRAGRPVHRPHRAQDQRGAEKGDGRGSSSSTRPTTSIGRPTTSIGRRTNAIVGRRRSKTCCRSWRTTARTSSSFQEQAVTYAGRNLQFIACAGS
jgi:hypothetical protein